MSRFFQTLRRACYGWYLLENILQFILSVLSIHHFTRELLNIDVRKVSTSTFNSYIERTAWQIPESKIVFKSHVYKFNRYLVQLEWDKYELKFVDMAVSSLTVHSFYSLCLKQLRIKSSSPVDICLSITAVFSRIGHDANLIAQHKSHWKITLLW